MKFISKGNTAEIIEYNSSLVCKLFYSGYPQIYVQHEFNNANAVSRLGIKTPQAHRIICVEGRNGIIYDRVIGEELSSLINSADKSMQTMWINKFVDFHKVLLSHIIDNVMDYKCFLKLFSANSVEINSRINELENGNALLHGDFHPANIIVNTTGELILIDMMNICKGPVEYDIARTYFLLENNKKLQSEYLERMGYHLAEITPYLKVISLIRENEKK